MNHDEKIDTMEKIFKFASQRFAKKRCLGTRKIIEEKKVDGPNGKKFTKLVMASDYEWLSYQEVYNESTCIGRYSWIFVSLPVGGFPIEIKSQISLLITYSLAIFIV